MHHRMQVWQYCSAWWVFIANIRNIYKTGSHQHWSHLYSTHIINILILTARHDNLVFEICACAKWHGVDSLSSVSRAVRLLSCHRHSPASWCREWWCVWCTPLRDVWNTSSNLCNWNEYLLTVATLN